MQTLTQVFDFSHGLSASFRQHRATDDSRYLQGASLRFELIYDVEESDRGRNMQFIQQLLEENFSARVFADQQDPHLDWFRMGEKLGVLKLTVIPTLSYPTIAFQVFTLIDEALKQKPLGLTIKEVRVFQHDKIVSYVRKEEKQ